MTLITHRGQHPYRHKAQEIAYTNLGLPGITNVKELVDFFLSREQNITDIINTPPTQSELVALLGLPDQDSPTTIIDSGGLGEYVVRVFSIPDHENWYYEVLTKADDPS